MNISFMETQFAIQTVGNILHVDATIIRSFSKSYFHISYHRRMPVTLAMQRPGLGDACQSGKMATLLNSLFFVFKISLLPNYPVKYYDYIVKLYSSVACNWCVLLDFSFNAEATLCVGRRIGLRIDAMFTQTVT